MSLDTAAAGKLLAHLADRPNDRDNSKIRLSGAGSCSRQLGYTIIGAPREPDPPSLLVTFSTGHAYHAMVQRWLVDIGWVEPGFLEYTMIDEARRIRGTCDAVTVRLGDDGSPFPAGRRRIIEIKSISNMPRVMGGRELGGAFDGLEKPRDHHIDQATCYAQLWNQANPEDPVTFLTFIYVPKDTREQAVPLKVFTQPFSPKRWARLEAKFARIWEYLDRGEIPPRDHDPTSAFSHCKFCPYKALCLESDREAEPTLFDLEETHGT